MNAPVRNNYNSNKEIAVTATILKVNLDDEHHVHTEKSHCVIVRIQ